MTAWQLEKIYEYTIHWAGCHKVDETTCVILIIKFCFSPIGLNSIFSSLPQSEYTSRAVSTPCVRYIRACVYFCLLSIQCFSVVQPETRFHFQSANQIAKKGQNFQKFHTRFKNFPKNSKL